MCVCGAGCLGVFPRGILYLLAAFFGGLLAIVRGTCICPCGTPFLRRSESVVFQRLKLRLILVVLYGGCLWLMLSMRCSPRGARHALFCVLLVITECLR